MGSMVVGFSAGYTSPALVTMSDRNITSFEVSEQAVSTQWAQQIDTSVGWMVSAMNAMNFVYFRPHGWVV